MSAENKNNVSRRGLLSQSAVAAAMITTGVHGADSAREARARARYAARRRSSPIGLQLYSVREECKKDLPGTIEAVAKMGYKGVEFAGYYNYTAKQLRKMLDDNGLKCCGTHTGLPTLLGDELPKTIEFNKTIGNKWLDTAKLFNELAEKVKPHDMLVGYHNHSVEFQPMNGELPWDTFYGNTKKDVVMQLDVGNAMHGGVDPLPYLYKYEGRAITVHVKEYSETDSNAFVGEGDVNWKAFFALCRAVGSTEWYIVEYERKGAPPLESVEKCLKNLRKLRLV